MDSLLKSNCCPSPFKDGCSDYFLRFCSDIQDCSNYRSAITRLIEGLVLQFSGNLHSVYLFGGLVRDGHPIPGWSDIDLLVVFRSIRERSTSDLGGLVSAITRSANLRIDLVQAELRELVDSRYLCRYSNGSIINALLFPGVVSQLLWGSPIVINPEIARNDYIQFSYIHNTLGLFRDYICAFYMSNGSTPLVVAVPRLARWAFSIVRSSLRLDGIWTHPYEDSLPDAKRIYGDLDFQILDALCAIRRDWCNRCGELNEAHIQRLEKFVEAYVPEVILRHAKHLQIST
jgi:predicted nucleotidyltransferase